jgi:predicted GH43/DUF377 family glycosyl hydrolase
MQRLNDGNPILRAREDGWDNDYTLNPTAHYLRRGGANDALIRGISGAQDLDAAGMAEGAVAVFYRGIAKQKPGEPALRSSVGLAVFTPELKLVRRLDEPVMRPSDDPEGFDYNGVEDQRIIQIGDTFYLVYCGWVVLPNGDTHVKVCLAESRDLLSWTKLGPARGDINEHPNKDAVLFPGPFEGRYYMLHRPCQGKQSEFAIRLAVSNSPTGEWTDLGRIMLPWKAERYRESWIGAGSAPLPLGAGRYLFDYHTGNYLPNDERDYFADFGIIDLNRLHDRGPAGIVTSRVEEALFPETKWERNSPWPHDKPLHCIFPCGSYEHRGDIVLVYGAGDAYVCAAKTPKADILAALGFGDTR